MEGEHKDPYRYADIIDLPHPVSPVHPRMSLSDRAAQFAPFAALTGYEDAVRESARLTDGWAELDEDSKEDLDRRLALLQAHLGERPEVTITFFQPDDKKAGGAYQSVSGRLKRIDPHGRRLILTDGTSLPMQYIVQLQSPLTDCGEES